MVAKRRQSCLVLFVSSRSAVFVLEKRFELEALNPQLAFSTKDNSIQFVQMVEKAISSETFRQTIRTSVRDQPGFKGFLVLFSWGVSRIPGGAILGILFFSCTSLLMIVSCATTTMVFVYTIKVCDFNAENCDSVLYVQRKLWLCRCLNLRSSAH